MAKYREARGTGRRAKARGRTQAAARWRPAPKRGKVGRIGASSGAHGQMEGDRRRRGEQIDGHRHRALADLHTWRVLRDELGAAQAERLLARAQYAYGLTLGAEFKKFAPSDFRGLHDALLASLPDAGRPFQPEVNRLDGQALEIRLRRSPYRSAWREAGAAQAEVESLSRVVAAMWAGLFKGAGFAYVGRTERVGDAEVHFLHIGRGAEAAGCRQTEHPTIV